ncbi:MAG TPA: thrombospondin type 3 repeat-containing protein [Kofleriaceae bacterium]|nr:thrombospondin type 3 repeat-containing protein [Kofleriaceae bacterium]
MIRALASRTLLLLPLLAACGDDGNSADPDGGGVDAATPDASGDPDGGGPSVVVSCPDPVPAAASGTCDVVTGTGSAILLHGTVLGAGTVYENGYVLIEGDAITCVGCDCDDETAAATAKLVNCADAVISPGLINPHDHLTFTEGAPIDTGTTRYDHRHDWRGTLSTPQNPHGTGQTSAGMRWGEIRMALGGATSLIGSGRALGMVRNLDDLETEEGARGLQEIDFETFPLGDSNETFHANCTWNYRTDELRVSQLAGFLPHVAEGINTYAAEEFRCQSTSFGGGQDFTERNTAHIHSIGLQAADYYRMALDRAPIIWSPRSNIALYGMTAQVTTFARFGGTIALGTDWTYSGSANLLRELACADEWNTDRLGSFFTDEELWKMVTINAAHASANTQLLGSIEVGKLADLSIFAAGPGVHHRGVLQANNSDVALTLKGGKPLVGEADTIASLGETCEAIDVCGKAHAICAMREFGTPYDTIESTVSGAYPAVFCGTPPGEPTCIPSRPGQYTGASTATDTDGDGIEDSVDNCPTVFNPIRPIDNGVQPDADQDGIGDPCDATPLPADLDGDTIANGADNCPFDSNTDQTDGDADGKGDACDFCPTVPNPTSVCPEAPPADDTITNIQMGITPVGRRVTIRDVVVTSVFNSGITVQDPAAGATYSGIYVFTGTSTGATIGQRVDVTGDVEEYFQNTELENATVTILGAGTAIVPTDLTVAQAATEPYEGVLVRLTNITDVVYPYSCSADNAACSDQDLWQVNGTTGILVYKHAYGASDWTTHVGKMPVTGVMMYRFDRRRIMPRTAADFGN